MIHYVRVAVALSRPPKIDEWRRYCVVAATTQEARLIATQMAACTSVMPVESHWESSHRSGPVEPYGVMDCTCWHVSWDEDLQCFTDPEVWEVAASCPHHSEDTAAWAALDGGTGVPWDGSKSSPGVLYGVDPNLRMPDQDPEEAALIASCEPVECPPGTHSMFDFCPGDCGDDFESGTPRNPPTPETANAGGPDTDDTPGSIDGQPVEWGDGFRYATGAIVPDELKRRVDTVKVSCRCEQVDITVFADGPNTTYTRGRTDGDCPYHGDLAQIRAFGHIDVGDRLRVNDFGVWSIDRAGGVVAGPGSAKSDLVPGLLSPRYYTGGEVVGPAPDGLPAAISPGELHCAFCDDWGTTFGDGGAQPDHLAAVAALKIHQIGVAPCSSVSPRRPATLRTRLRSWLKRR